MSGKYGDKIECNGDLCVQIATKSIVINNEHKNAFPVAQMVEGIALLRDLYKNNENFNLKTINNYVVFVDKWDVIFQLLLVLAPELRQIMDLNPKIVLIFINLV